MRSDGNPGQTGDRENPSYVRDILCPLSRVELDLRNPSRPAVFDPHQQAGHKTAPDRDAKLQKSSCNAGTIHTGHRVDLTVGCGLPKNVRFPCQGHEAQLGTYIER
jgi:hypothetical protein